MHLLTVVGTNERTNERIRDVSCAGNRWIQIKKLQVGILVRDLCKIGSLRNRIRFEKKTLNMCSSISLKWTVSESNVFGLALLGSKSPTRKVLSYHFSKTPLSVFAHSGSTILCSFQIKHRLCRYIGKRQRLVKETNNGRGPHSELRETSWKWIIDFGLSNRVVARPEKTHGSGRMGGDMDVGNRRTSMCYEFYTLFLSLSPFFS